MANNSLFDNMGLTNFSYLLEEEESGAKPTNVKNDELIPINKLVPFKKHTFKVNTEDAAFQELVESIKEGGLIYPILVRPVGNLYEIIAGHRRVEASKAAGLTEVPAIIKVLSDFEATFVMVHSNLYRPEISISEKAKSYRLLRDEGKHQGVKGEDTAAMMGEQYSDSRRKVYRYIRLSYLTDEFLEMVDTKSLSVNIGLEIAVMDEDTQKQLYDFLREYKVKLSITQAENLAKKYSANNSHLGFEELTAELLASVVKKKASTKVTFKREQLQEYFEPDTDEETMSNVIFTLLRKYKDGVLDEYLENV